MSVDLDYPDGTDFRACMDLTPELLSAANRVSSYHRRFIEWASKESRALDRAEFQGIAQPHCCVPAQVQSWPAMVDANTVKEFGRVSEGLFRLIKKIPDLFFDYDPAAMSDFYHLNQDFISHFVLKAADRTTIDGVFGRGDFILGMDRLWCAEFNMGTNVGGVHEPLAWHSQMTSIQVISQFLRNNKLSARVRNTTRCMMRHIVSHALKSLPHVVDELNTAYILDHGSFAHDPEFRDINDLLDQEYQLALREIAPKMQGSFICSGFDDLVASGNDLFCGKKQIRILVELTSGDIPTRLLRCYNGRSFTIHIGPLTFALCNKLNLALLSEFSHCDLFDQDEQELISNHIPWTRKVTRGSADFDGVKVDLPEFIVENRKELVLKKSISSSGHDVFVGAGTSPEEWAGALATAFQHEDWVVQRYVPSPPFLFQDGHHGCSAHDVIWGLFVMNEEYSGAFLRVMPKSGCAVVNRSRGSMDGVVLEVTENPGDDSWVSFDSESGK